MGWSSQPGTGMPQSMSRVMARGRMSSRNVLGDFDDVGTPRARLFAFIQPGGQGIGQGGQVEEVVDGLHEVRGLTVDARVRVDELGRVHLVAAVVALVARAPPSAPQIGQVPSM